MAIAGGARRGRGGEGNIRGSNNLHSSGLTRITSAAPCPRVRGGHVRFETRSGDLGLARGYTPTRGWIPGGLIEVRSATEG